MLLEVGNQRTAVSCTLFLVAQIVDFQSQEVRNPQFTPQIGTHGNHFGIDIGAVKPQSFYADLMKLTVTAFLRPFAAEHRPHIP
jgi:hypothetical protein